MPSYQSSPTPPLPVDQPTNTQAPTSGSPQQGGAGGYVGVVPSPQDARQQGGDILLRQQALLKQISSLVDQLSNLVTIAPFLQDEAMMMMQIAQSMQAKVMTIAGQDAESSQQGQADAQAQGVGAGSNSPVSTGPPTQAGSGSQAIPPMPQGQ